VPTPDTLVDYALSADLIVGPALAGASIECPTHPLIVQTQEGGAVQASLAPGASLDRDVMFIVTPREPRPSLMLRAQDDRDASAPVVVLAALQPPLLPAREHIAIKLLLDCSGSMEGDSIGSARRALRSLVSDLSPTDRISLQRFGSTLQTVLGPSDATPEILGCLMPVIDRLHADLGGTELAPALDATLAQDLRTKDGEAADLLLISDGAVWNVTPAIEQARASGQRVFVIGVGSSAAEDPLRQLAQATGGACECVTPGEALEKAAHRMLQRIRQVNRTAARIDWGTPPLWSTDIPPNIFGGETVLAFAGFARAPEPRRIRLLGCTALNGAAADGMATDGMEVELARLEAEAPCPGDTLARLAAARRSAASTPATAKDLALHYQLIGPQTCAVLVHGRADADRSMTELQVHRIPSMWAAGAHGWGSVSAGGARDVDRFIAMQDDDWPRARLADRSFMRSHPLGPVEERRWFQAAIGSDTHRPTSVSVLDLMSRVTAKPAVRLALAEAQPHLPDPELAPVVLAHWLINRPQGPRDPILQSQIAAALSGIDPAIWADVVKLFEDRLGRMADEGLLDEVWR
jgi:Ca-activated chloride channel homolog